MEETRRTQSGSEESELDVPLIRSIPDFGPFYASEFESVAALAYVLSGSRVASDDLAQDAFLVAYRRWGEIGRYDKPGAWVRLLVANRSVSLHRRAWLKRRRWHGSATRPP